LDIGGLESIGGVGLIGRRGRGGIEEMGRLGFRGKGARLLGVGLVGGGMKMSGLDHWLGGVTIAEVISDDWLPVQCCHTLSSFLPFFVH